MSHAVLEISIVQAGVLPGSLFLSPINGIEGTVIQFKKEAIGGGCKQRAKCGSSISNCMVLLLLSSKRQNYTCDSLQLYCCTYEVQIKYLVFFILS